MSYQEIPGVDQAGRAFVIGLEYVSSRRTN